MKRHLSLVLLSVLALSSIIGCSAGADTAKGTTAAPKPGEVKKTDKEAPKEEVLLKVGMWGENDSRKKILEAYVQQFTAKNPHIKVEFMLVPFADYQQKLSIMVASRTAPDLVWMSDKMIPQFIEAKQLADISEIQNDKAYDFNDNIPSSFQRLKKDGKLYGVPFLNPPKVIFYNKTLFKEKGLKTPLEQYKDGKWTYDEYIQAAKTISDPSKGIYGNFLITANGWKAWEDAFLDTFWAYGADFMNEESTKFMLNSPEGEKAFQLISDMMFKDQIHPKPGDQITFEGGKIGMSRQNYAYVNTARNIKNFEWDIAPMPKGPNTDAPAATGLAAYSVMQESKHKPEALELLKFMTSKEAMTEFAFMYVPNRSSVLASDALTKGFESPTKEGIKAALIDPMNGKLRAQNAHKNWQQIDVKVQTIIDLLYTRNMTPKEMLKKMEEEVTPLMK
ncbi:sugar ABC transporter substrate-binding protein [Paenibacillus sp. WQ 127069]|uniref:Sugar ABC transporter substrate-binding protein n=1 Tax=Paenibacillus baimaensis TaxID=2982185 RepID=A0ABT2UBP8_9BACL|nr:sugar ABC transporter substrate-binding protein [Paenibacillus sp. WQ 127069]MCU6792047.1 sugar ABC transporter substrate-binding protein [Paenibacillus sp. WQ 127069]